MDFIYVYGKFSRDQIIYIARQMHNEIHRLLIYKDINIPNKIFQTDKAFFKYFNNLLINYGSLNDMFGYPAQMVLFMERLNSAYIEAKKEDFNYSLYKKELLDAHGLLTEMFGEVRENVNG